MCVSVEQIVEQIHSSRGRFVLAISGGGGRAVSALLEMPGASRTVLEVVVPYSAGAMIKWLGGRPDQFCSPHTARAMATVGLLRAIGYDESDALQFGAACTASLATDRPKRGPHRVHLALQTTSLTKTRSVELQKGHRIRQEEEQLVARLVLNMVAEACGLEGRLELDLLEGERLDESQTIARQPWRELFLGHLEMVRHGGAPYQEGEPPGAVFPGAFNPVHVGHRRMAEISRRLLGRRVDFEISILNPDKPPLDYLEMERRTGQFGPAESIWLTRAPTFEEKSRLFPGTTFIVGTDTLRRIARPCYYGDDPAARDAAMQRIAERGCRFLVFGRDLGTGFFGLGDLDLPEPLVSLCREVPAEQFRQDISSTEIRKSGGW